MFKLKVGAIVLFAAIAAVQAHGQAAKAPVLQFEVDSVRENPEINGRSHIWSASHDPSFRTQNVTLLALLQFAFDLPESQILDVPPSIKTKKFDIDAKADGLREEIKAVSDDEGKEQKRQMLLALLRDRFQLSAHIETRELPVYVLTVAKDGAKLTPTKSDGLTINTSSNRMSGEGWTTEQLARQLARVLGRPVVDRTGIQNRFDASLRWSSDEDAARANGDPDAPPSIFTAVQEQLGLKLEAQKGPVRVLVVDHVEMPVAN